MEKGTLTNEIADGVAYLRFGHAKANSLPLALLESLSAAIEAAGRDPAVRVIALSSEGEKAFCAGASFEEFQRITTAEDGRRFFMGFANLLLSMRAAPKLVVVRVQGKVVGGGVGVVSAADYVLATNAAQLRLSEFELGIGPFTIGPAVERRIGTSRFSAMAIDTAWREAEWALATGLYQQVLPDIPTLDEAFDKMLRTLASRDTRASAALKAVLWEGTEHWPRLLPQRAEISGELLARAP
ncbi:MAG: enoyl-CoA hydratase/isomerase family protein [Bdellovibrionales bacterium]|nr:enoyl-CoA hydratase/isomerase family protein [Bdellovibrionales bacterium]